MGKIFRKAATAHYNCYVKSGQQTRCAPVNTRLASNGSWSRAVTVYTGKHRNGSSTTLWIDTNRSGDRCTKRTTDRDLSTALPAGFRGTVSSVKDYAGRHCDWRLVGRNGGKSTWVQNDWGNLSHLGNGWNNRAYRIQLT